MKIIGVLLGIVCLATARSGAADVTSAFGTSNAVKQRREAVKVVLPSPAGESAAAADDEDKISVYYSDDSSTNYTGVTWRIGDNAAEYSLQAGPGAGQLKVLAYRRGYKLLAQTFDIGDGKTPVWKPAFEKLPTVPVKLHLTDGAGTPVAGEPLQIGFAPEFSTYPYGDSKTSMGLPYGTLWVLGEGQTDEKGDLEIFIADLGRDETWLANQKNNGSELIVAQVGEPRHLRGDDFSSPSYLNSDRVYVSEPMTAQRLTEPGTMEVRRLFLTPLAIRITQSFLDRKKWTKAMFSPESKSSERDQINLTLRPVFDQPATQQTHHFYQLFSRVSLDWKARTPTSATGADATAHDVAVGDAAIALAFGDEVIPGVYDVEVQVTHYAPAKNGMITATLVRRETIARRVIVHEKELRVLTLE